MFKTEPTFNTNDLGVELSQMLKWDGLAILLVAQAALTDANFHGEAKVIDGLISDNIPF